MNIQQNLNQSLSLMGLLYTQTAAFEIKKQKKLTEAKIADLEKRENQAIKVEEDLSQTKDYAEATHQSTIEAEKTLLDLARERYSLQPTTSNIQDLGQYKENLARTQGMTEEEKTAEHLRRGGATLKKKMTNEEAQHRAFDKVVDERERYGYMTIDGAVSTWRPYKTQEGK